MDYTNGRLFFLISLLASDGNPDHLDAIWHTGAVYKREAIADVHTVPNLPSD